MADAEDLVQSALSRCLRSWRRVARADNRDAYVNRILINTLHDSRARRWNGEFPTDVLPEETQAEPDVAAGLVVRRALATLNRDHREVLVLRFFADMSERQAAEALGVPAGTVKSRTARALTALSEHDDIATLAAERSPGC